MILFRQRTHKQLEWKEYYFEINSNRLCLPQTMPIRFQNRSRECSVGFEVFSANFNEPIKISQSSIESVWLCKFDCERSGDILDEKIGKRQFFNVTIDEESAKKVLEQSNSKNEPICVYHGTSEINKNSIVKDLILTPTNGMLGSAIYVGTFYKACRFAMYDQAYERRKCGYIFRLLAFPKSIVVFPRDGWICNCETCKNFNRPISDHNGEWKKYGDCAHAKISTSKEICKNGSPKMDLRNEEWALNHTVLQIIVQYAEFDQDSFRENHYDPYNRSVKIL